MTINILQSVEFKFNKIHAVFSKIHAERQEIIEKRIKKTKYQEKTAEFACFQQWPDRLSEYQDQWFKVAGLKSAVSSKAITT